MVSQMGPLRSANLFHPVSFGGAQQRDYSLPSPLPNKDLLRGSALSVLVRKGRWEDDKDKYFFPGPALFSEGPQTCGGHSRPWIVPGERLLPAIETLGLFGARTSLERHSRILGQITFTSI